MIDYLGELKRIQNKNITPETFDQATDSLEAISNALIGTATDEEKVFYDSASAFAGVVYPVGTRQQPVNNLADLRTILAARDLRTVVMLSNLTLDANMVGYIFMSEGPYPAGPQFDPNGFGIGTDVFYHVYLTGAPSVGGAAIYAYECSVGGGFVVPGTSYFVNSIILDVTHEIHAMVYYANCTFNVSTMICTHGEVRISNGHIINTLGIQSLTDAATTSYVDVDGGLLFLNGSNTFGTMELYGTCNLLDAAAAGFVLNDHRGLLGTNIAAYNGMIHFDEFVGVAGTAFPIGTPNNPCSSEADVKTICIATNIYKVSIRGNFDVPSAMEAYEFIGGGRYSALDTINFNGQDVDASSFRFLNIVGAQGGTSPIICTDCQLFNATNIMGTFFRCLFQTATLRGGGGSVTDMLECTGWQGAATITVTTPVSFNLFSWSGALVLEGLAAGGTVNSYGTGALITLAATCVGGTVNLYGDARVINNSLVACLVNDYTVQKIYGTYNVPAGLVRTLDKSVEIIGDLTIAAGAGSLTINGNCQVSGNIDIGAGATLTIRGNCEVGGTITNGALSTLNIYGNCVVNGGGFTNTTGTINIAGNCEVDGNDLTNTIGPITINGNLICRSISNTGLLGAITIRGNCTVLLTLSNDSTGIITIGGNLYVTSFVHNHSTGDILVAGDCFVGGALTNDGGAGCDFIVTGIARIYGAITNTGTLTYHGVYPEVAVSIHATNVTAEVFHLPVTTGFVWKVEKLRLKCEDPTVANTVTVTLEEFVNGALVAVDTFVITSAISATYLSLMDMFGVDHLTGNELRVSVLCSAAGPYDVTASYAYRSD